MCEASQVLPKETEDPRELEEYLQALNRPPCHPLMLLDNGARVGINILKMRDLSIFRAKSDIVRPVKNVVIFLTARKIRQKNDDCGVAKSGSCIGLAHTFASYR